MDEAIVISWPNGFDDPLAEEILQLNQDDFIVISHRTEPMGFMAVLEWAMPTAFIVYLSGIFFKSFLTEAGKDAYLLSKSKVKEYILQRRKFRTQFIAAKASPDKLSKTYDQSLTISLKARVHPNLNVTVLFTEKVSEEEANEMIEEMFSCLSLLYQELQNQNANESTNSKRMELYLLANSDTKKWELLTQLQITERYRNK